MSKVEQHPSDNETACGVRARAFAIGLVCVIAVCVIVGYGELVASVFGSINAILLGANHMPPSAIGVLIVLLFGNALLRLINPLARLRQGELAVIYFMMVCAALLSSFGLTAQLLSCLVGINYFANPQNGWRDTFYHHIKSWMVPWDPHGPNNQAVSRAFYEGLRIGEPLPWKEWVVPLAAWTVFAFLLFFLSACIATLVRRQWVDGERLAFPLVQLPLEMVGETPGDRFLHNRLMWLGLAIPVSVHTLNGLHMTFPAVPEIRVFWTVNEFLVNKPWRDMYITFLVVSFSVVGFSYLLPLEVSFSIWFFHLLARLQDVIGSSLGYTFAPMPQYPAQEYQGYQCAGAFTVIAISLIWLGRHHWRLVLGRVFGKLEQAPDQDEFMSYRTAFWGMSISFALMVAWLWAAGTSLVVAVFTLGTFVFIILLVLSRCVAEVGLLMMTPAFRPLDLWALFSTRASLGAANFTTLAFVNSIFMRDPRTLMPAFLNAMKISDGVGARKRSFAIGMAMAIILGVLVAYIIQLNIIYHRGGLRLNSWFCFWNPQIHFYEAKATIEGPTGFDKTGPTWFTVGAIFTFFLYAMRSRFCWWPFHPLGYAISAAWPAMVHWSAFFVGWLLKLLIMRYGGARGYRIFRPFFLGLIFGEFLAAIIWAIMIALFGVSGPMIPIN